MNYQHPIPAPAYYTAIFGDPDGLSKKDRVEDGRYLPGSCPWPLDIKEGDILLLYCTGSYLAHSMEVPGIGIVLQVDQPGNAIYYRYLQLETPISIEAVRSNLDIQDLEKFELRRFSNFWIFDITRQSFKSVIREATFVWP